MGEKRKVEAGIYLVIDPAMDAETLIGKLKLILEEKIVAVQFWDNFNPDQNYVPLIEAIIRLCHEKAVPVLINNRWQWLSGLELDGVHFDNVPHDFKEIKKTLGREFITGVTCNNDLSVVHWANTHGLDYVSFCSVFPSSTSNSCELVSFETIREAKTIANIPVFLAGGITLENLPKLRSFSYDGVAVVSGIMSSETPQEAVKEYLKELNVN